jgi:hypothetical protein
MNRYRVLNGSSGMPAQYARESAPGHCWHEMMQRICDIHQETPDGSSASVMPQAQALRQRARARAAKQDGEIRAAARRANASKSSGPKGGVRCYGAQEWEKGVNVGIHARSHHAAGDAITQGSGQRGDIVILSRPAGDIALRAE